MISICHLMKEIAYGYREILKMLRVISDFALWELIEDSKQYKMILYADSKYKKSILRVLDFIDVRLEYQISDEDELDSRSIYDLIYEDKDDIMVIVAKENYVAAQDALVGMGLQLGVNFKNIERYSRETNLFPYYYDPVMGYNLETKEKNATGFIVYGNIEKMGLRILTLGGSTTDASIYPFKSWSECLHEVLEERGLSNVIMCGGVAGYASSEELFKMIRDGFPLKPNIVLNYSGVNDMQVEGDYPYINFYMRQISQYLMCKKEIETLNFDGHKFGVSYGVNTFSKGDLMEKGQFWINNQKMIHDLCQSRTIKHMTFFQPSLFNDEKEMSKQEQSYKLNLVYVGVQRERKSEYIEKVKEFGKLVKQDINKYEWIYDLSGVFGSEDVYIDMCHVNENGNRIIAERIADIVCENI